jgi:hypothetical protein
MSRLTDPDVLGLFLEALENWRWKGFLAWRRVAAEWLRKNLDECSQELVNQLMYEHVLNGGEIDQVRETREGYRDNYEHHYDFRIRVGTRFVYIETTLDRTRMGPTVNIVSIHDA